MVGGLFVSGPPQQAARRYGSAMKPNEQQQDWEPPPEPREQTKVPSVKAAKVRRVPGARRRP
jgi:hypothetical protein